MREEEEVPYLPFQAAPVTQQPTAPFLADAPPRETKYDSSASFLEPDRGLAAGLPDLHYGKGKLALDQWLYEPKQWDLFIQDLYTYFLGGGKRLTQLRTVLQLLLVYFIGAFATFFFGCIDHAKITQVPTMMEATRSACLLSMPWFLQTSFCVFLLFAALRTREAWLQIKKSEQLAAFYKYLLQIPDTDLPIVQWKTIGDRFLALYQASATQFAFVMAPARFTSLTLILRLMKRDAFLLALFHRGALPLLPAIRWQRTVVRRVWGLDGLICNWTAPVLLYLLAPLFIEKAGTPLFKRDRMTSVREFRRRCRFVGLLNIILSPFIVFFLAIYYLFRYGEEVHRNPQSAGTRAYTPLARWRFLEYSEYPHLFEQRLKASMPHAAAYLQSFPAPQTEIIGKFLAMIFGSLAFMLFLISLVDESALLKELTAGRSVLWYLSLFGLCWTTSRAIAGSDRDEAPSISKAEEHVKAWRDHCRYWPAEWYGRSTTWQVRSAISQFFTYRPLILIMDLFAVLLSPTIFLVSLPNAAERIVDEMNALARETKDAGWICSAAAFEESEEAFEDAATGAREFEPLPRQTAKMEQSILQFKVANPEWQPANAQTAAFLDQIHHFVEERRHPRAKGEKEHQSFPAAVEQQIDATQNSNQTDLNRFASAWSASSPERDPLKLTEAGRGILDLLDQIHRRNH